MWGEAIRSTVFVEKEDFRENNGEIIHYYIAGKGVKWNIRNFFRKKDSGMFCELKNMRNFAPAMKPIGFLKRLFSSVGQSTWFVISGSLVRIRQEAQK